MMCCRKGCGRTAVYYTPAKVDNRVGPVCEGDYRELLAAGWTPDDFRFMPDNPARAVVAALAQPRKRNTEAP